MSTVATVAIVGPQPHAAAHVYAESRGWDVVDIGSDISTLDCLIVTQGWELDHDARPAVGQAIAEQVELREHVAANLCYSLAHQSAWRRMQLTAIPELPEPTIDPDWEFADPCVAAA